jgi:hypothetical protein
MKPWSLLVLGVMSCTGSTRGGDETSQDAFTLDQHTFDATHDVELRDVPVDLIDTPGPDILMDVPGPVADDIPTVLVANPCAIWITPRTGPTGTTFLLQGVLFIYDDTVLIQIPNAAFQTVPVQRPEGSWQLNLLIVSAQQYLIVAQQGTSCAGSVLVDVY